MDLRAIILLLIALVIGGLAALNWSTLATPTLISLGVTDVQAPLGLIMLGLTVLLGVFFLAYVIYLQSVALLETRRHTKELQAQRDLAERAEVSRYTELRAVHDNEVQLATTRERELRDSMFVRIDRLERDLAARVDQSGNTLAAYIGELEDRLEGKTVAGRSSVATPFRDSPDVGGVVPVRSEEPLRP